MCRSWVIRPAAGGAGDEYDDGDDDKDVGDGTMTHSRVTSNDVNLCLKYSQITNMECDFHTVLYILSMHSV